MLLTNVKDYIVSIILWCARFQLLNYIKWSIRHFSTGITDSVTCLVGKTAIVTGGNSGIGFATSVLLASRGCRVIIACRSDAEKEKKTIIDQTGNPNILVKKLDLAKLSSVRSFAEEIKRSEPKIDILINNAGIGVASEHCTEDGLNYAMQVNYFAPVLLTYLLLDQLRAGDSPRVVFLSSMLAYAQKLTMDNLNLTKFKMNADNVSNFYTNSKLCNIIASQVLAKKLSKTGILINTADPGIITTSIFQRSYSIDVESKWSLQAVLETLQVMFATDSFKGAQSSIHLATSKNIGSGDLYFRCKPFVKPRMLYDTEFCEKIWMKTEELLGINFDIE